MKKTIFTTHSKAVQRKLVQMREQAGLTHRELATLLGREHSFVWRIEHGERRLDVVEFFWVCRALGQDAAAVYEELSAAFERIEAQESKPKRK